MPHPIFLNSNQQMYDSTSKTSETADWHNRLFIRYHPRVDMSCDLRKNMAAIIINNFLDRQTGIFESHILVSLKFFLNENLRKKKNIIFLKNLATVL